MRRRKETQEKRVWNKCTTDAFRNPYALYYDMTMALGLERFRDYATLLLVRKTIPERTGAPLRIRTASRSTLRKAESLSILGGISASERMGPVA
ncbi:unnamed protein product [Enterobius vermicularis]|uniref:Tnp_DDE_dom domain-containing protein n=1 Tax=Enterobius vermicularis TaxID=51028 RepID=A0A0N4VD45_ENTVE|nr:unnamed protein product [Enterobius vermicularis]